MLASGSGDGTVRLWALADHSCIRTLEGHASSVLKLAFLTHGAQLITAYEHTMTNMFWTDFDT